MFTADDADLRSRTEAELLAAVRAGRHAALAEIWRRTAAAAQAVARRALGVPAEVEAVLVALYREVWQGEGAEPLERWLRARCFALAAATLREQGRPPAAASMACLLPDLPPAGQPVERVERLLAGLDRADVAALARAHDAGLPSHEQPDPGAAAALERALLALAEADAPATVGSGSVPLGDLVLGLLGRAGSPPPEGDIDRLRLLRRGRRRLEGLTPTADLGSRVLLAAVTAAPVTAPAPTPVAARAAAESEPMIVPAVRHNPAPSSEPPPPEPPLPEDIVVPISRLLSSEPAPAMSGLAPTATESGTVPPLPVPEPTDAATEVRRGLGLLLIGTALGLLAGAITLALR